MRTIALINFTALSLLAVFLVAINNGSNYCTAYGLKTMANNCKDVSENNNVLQ